MKFRTLFAALLIFIAPLNKAQAVNLGPFAVTEQFCEQFTKVGAILNAFQIIQWPVAGFPGIVQGLTQRTSVIHDICDFITQLSQLDGIDAIFFTGSYLNELTGRKWDHHLRMADQTWNLANTVYDFESGETRKSTLVSESTARELNDWMESAYTWQGKTFNGEEVYVKHRQEREREMADIARLAYRRAILAEATNCPKPPDDNPNFQKIYASKIKPEEVKKDFAQDDIDFYRGQLMYMGPRFMNNEDQLKDYINGIELLMRDGVSYKMKEGSVNEETSKPSDNKDKEEHVIPKTVQLKRKAYTYTSEVDEKMFTEFKEKWRSQWQTWVTAQWSSQGTFGILVGPAEQVEAEFKDLTYECGPTRVTRGMNPDDPKFEKLKDQKIKECLETVTSNERQAGGLLDYYVNSLKESLRVLKSSNATIWTLESKHAGINRLIPLKSQNKKFEKESFLNQEEVVCSEKLTPAEMSLLQTKQQNITNEILENISKNTAKQTIMKEIEVNNRKNQAEEYQMKVNHAESINKRNAKQLDKSITPYTTKSGM